MLYHTREQGICKETLKFNVPSEILGFNFLMIVGNLILIHPRKFANKK